MREGLAVVRGEGQGLALIILHYQRSGQSGGCDGDLESRRRAAGGVDRHIRASDYTRS